MAQPAAAEYVAELPAHLTATVSSGIDLTYVDVYLAESPVQDDDESHIIRSTN